MNVMKDFVKPTLVLSLICLVVAASLVFTYELTLPIIQANQNREADEARRVVLPEADSFTKVELSEKLDGAIECYKADNGAGYVITAQAKGFGGDMSVMVGMDSNGKITGVKLLDNSETPGLGSKTGEEAHTSKYVGKTSETLGEVTAVSGATVSSNAMKKAVEIAYGMYGQASGNAVQLPEAETVLTAADAAEALFPGQVMGDPVQMDENTVVYPVGDQMMVVMTVVGFNAEEPMQLAVGIDQAGAVTGLFFIEINETEGIGTQVSEGEYLDAYTGKTSADGIEAISGATISSTAINQAIGSALSQADSFRSKLLDATNRVYAEVLPGATQFEKVQLEGALSAAQAPEGMVIMTRVEGFGGEMGVLTGIDNDGKITGVKVIYNSETDGIGTRVAQAEHTSQYVGLDSADGVEAISGATVSSKALQSAVAQALELFKTAKGA